METKKKKIAIVYSGGKYWGGIETLETNRFKYYDKSKARLTFYSLGEWPLSKKLREMGVELRIFPKTRFQPLTVFMIAKKAKKDGVGLLVSGGLVADSYCRAASLFSGIPHLSTVHSSFNLDYPPGLRRSIYKFLIFLSSWKTKSYIAVSDYMKEELVRRGVAGEKINVIYNGAVLGRRPNKREHGSKTVISAVGRLHPVKNYPSLIRAVKLLVMDPALVNFEVRIYGEGPDKEKLQHQINELGVSQNIKLMGYAPDTMDVLEEADIYIQPSLSEGFGLGVVEAMLAGLPVIVTPTGSFKEIVKNEKTGLITKAMEPKGIAEALSRLILNKRLREDLGKSAKTYAEKEFDIKKWADSSVDTYLRIVNE